MNTLEAKIFALLPKDLIKACIIAGITAGAKIIYSAVQIGGFPTDISSWKSIGLATISAAGIYLLKNFLTNSDGKFLTGEKTE